MPFETLPSRNLQFPTIQPFTAPGPPVFETGSLMNLIAGNIRESSPEARLARQEAREAHKQALEISKLKTEELRYNRELLRDPATRERQRRLEEAQIGLTESHGKAYEATATQKDVDRRAVYESMRTGLPPLLPQSGPVEKIIPTDPTKPPLPAPEKEVTAPTSAPAAGETTTSMTLPRSNAWTGGENVMLGNLTAPVKQPLAVEDSGRVTSATQASVNDARAALQGGGSAPPPAAVKLVKTTPDGWDYYDNGVREHKGAMIIEYDNPADGLTYQYSVGEKGEKNVKTAPTNKKVPPDEFLTGAARAGVDIEGLKNQDGTYDRAKIAKEWARLRLAKGGEEEDPEAKALKDLMKTHQSGGLLSSVGRAKELTGWTTAGLASWLQHVPATDARKLAAELTTTKALLAGEALAQMKSVSSTGASGLGALSDKERVMLESMQGNLDQGLEPADLKDTLSRIEKRVQRWTTMVGILKKEGVEAATKYLETEQAKDGTTALITPEGAGAPARSPTPSPSPAPTPSATPAAGATPDASATPAASATPTAAPGEPPPGTVETVNGQQLVVGKTYWDENGHSAVYAGNGKFK